MKIYIYLFITLISLTNLGAGGREVELDSEADDTNAVSQTAVSYITNLIQKYTPEKGQSLSQQQRDNLKNDITSLFNWPFIFQTILGEHNSAFSDTEKEKFKQFFSILIESSFKFTDDEGQLIYELDIEEDTPYNEAPFTIQQERFNRDISVVFVFDPEVRYLTDILIEGDSMVEQNQEVVDKAIRRRGKDYFIEFIEEKINAAS